MSNLSSKSADGIFMQARQLRKTYDNQTEHGLEVLKGIDLTIRKGEIIAIIGPSGAGKSTLLHILGALDRPTSGDVQFGKEIISRMTNDRLAEFRNKHIGFVFQFHHLMPDFTALENVMIPGLIRSSKQRELKEQALRILHSVGLSDRVSHKPSELSGGEQQRVAFARSLINQPKMVLADEPSGNLDKLNSDALHDLMWNYVRKQGITFVVVTHNQELANQADRVIEMSDGLIHEIK